MIQDALCKDDPNDGAIRQGAQTLGSGAVDTGKPQDLPLDDEGKPRSSPVRTCISTRTVKPITEMIRFVQGPDKKPVPDLKASLPGRGVWISATYDAIEKAASGKAFSHGFKGESRPVPDLAAQVYALLHQRALATLSLAHKAGEVTFGMTKVDKAVERGVLALIHASDAGDDGVEKLDRKFHLKEGRDAPVFTIFAGRDLDMAFGRSNVIHAALISGRSAENSLFWLRRAVAYGNKVSVDEQERTANE